MIEALDNLDKQLFYFLNGLHHASLDPLMFAISGKILWIPLYIFLVYLIVKEWKKRWYVPLLAVGLAIGASDIICSQVLKPTTERLRPTRDPEMQDKVHKVNGYRGGMYSFASSHASISFAISLFFHFLFRRKHSWTWLLFIWAIIVAYSRIYLGVHFPGDIIAGALIGMGFGWLAYRYIT